MEQEDEEVNEAESADEEESCYNEGDVEEEE